VAEGIRIPIPPGAELVQPYPVHLPQFDGPLDLLLHLIRKDEIDLRNIPVVDICRQYHEYLVLMVELDLEVAAEFLYVEALLVQIKSQMVLPRNPSVEGGDAPDPREELVNRLLQYRKFKGVAETLHVYEVERIGMYPRPAYRPEAETEEEETDLSEVSLFDLLTLFKGAVDRFRAHLVEARRLMRGEHASGKRLDVLAQELHREANTASQKARELPLTRVLLDLKSDVEALKEQIQNVE
jgi:segregation and condensation protein A